MLKVKSSWKNWQLLTDKGRHIWAFKPQSKAINDHLKNVDDISDQEIAKFSEDFQFDKFTNPNSGDQVYRHAAINKKFMEFAEHIPQADNPEAQNVTVAVIKGINNFSGLQSDAGHWPGDSAGPFFLWPGLLLHPFFSV